METTLRTIENKFKSLEISELLIMSAVGLAVLFFGYRIKKVAFFIVWFLLGYNLILLLMPTIVHLVPQIAENSLYEWLLPIGGGLLLALLGFSIEKFCVGGICFALTMIIVSRYFGTDMQTLAIGATIGVIAAGAAVALMKPAIIVATSATGAYVLTLTILTLSQLSFSTFYWPLIIGITVIGSIFQFLTTKRVS